MKKKKKTLKQTNEVETGSFPEKYFRILRVKAKILKAKDLPVNTMQLLRLTTCWKEPTVE